MQWLHRMSGGHGKYRRIRLTKSTNTKGMFETELNCIFKDVLAAGDGMYAPSSTQPQPHGDDNEDVYIPTMDQQEGSGDSEDDDFGANMGVSAGVTDDLADINLRTNTAPSCPTNSRSRGKRKICECSIKSKKQKIASSKQIADAVSVIVAASRDRASVLKEIKETSLPEVMNELITMEELSTDDDLRNRCIKLMMDKTCQEIFVSLKANRPYLMSWLKDMAYNPPWKSPPPT